MGDVNARNHKRETALITGASSGIGYALAELFARHQTDLVLVARHEKKLQEIADQIKKTYGIQAVACAYDLSDPTALEQLFQQMQQHKIVVDILVNNAGFGTHGPFAQSNWAEQKEMIQLNAVALTHLTHLFLPAMISQKKGRILNIASTAAFQSGPFMSVYYATKAYVLSFSEAVADELQGTGVTVTVLCPGPTASEFQKRAGIEGTRLVATGMMTAKRVAQIGYDALMRGKPVAVAGWKNQFFVFCIRFLPRQLVIRIVRALQKERMRQMTPLIRV